MPGGVDISVTVESVNIDPIALASYVRSPSGDVYRQMFALGDRFKSVAVRIAPVSKPDPVPRAQPVVPGRLRDSIVKRMSSDGNGLFVRVGTVGTPYAKYVHEGTNPHPIDARRAPLLVFAQGGVIRYVKHVNHPGNAPNRWLVRAAIEVVGASNVRSV